MRGFVPVIHGAALDRPDEVDTIEVANLVCAALRRLGYDSDVHHFGLDLTGLERLAARKPIAVFNLVEALCGSCALAAIVPEALDHLGLRYTGARSAAYRTTLSKIDTKAALRRAGIPTADWWQKGDKIPSSGRVIIKSATEHASLGIDAASVVAGADAGKEIAAREARFGGEFFAEGFLGGREFNVSVVEMEDGPRVLPIPEITFVDWPEDRPRIVDYESKWEQGSPIYYQSPRRFGLNDSEPALAQRLEKLALDCWKLFDLSGYVRIDIRLDELGEPHVLEVNVNPCLASDAGFAVTAHEAGYSYDALVAAIIAAATGKYAPMQAPVIETEQPSSDALSWRHLVQIPDIERIRHLVEQTGFFTDAEIAIAAELVEERLSKGAASGYEFVLLERGSALLGYACYGLTPGTDATYDLYWIAVAPESQKHGFGWRILNEVEARVHAAKGQALYAETSSTDHYKPTRAFYERAGFRQVALLVDFYRAGDGKVIYEKPIAAEEGTVRAAE